MQWIGDIPEHWGMRKLSQISYEHFISNKDIHHQNLLSLSYGKIIRKDIKTTEGLLPASFNTYQVVEEGNIVMRLTDLQNDHKSLRVGLVKEEGIVTSAYVCIGVYNGVEIVPSFLYYVLHSYDIKKLFYSMGGGLRQNLNWQGLKKTDIPLPPLLEQERIVNFLETKTSKIDAYVAEKERELQLLSELKQTEIANVVTKGLNPNVKMKDSGIPWIGRIPEHWEIEPFGRHFSFGKGLPITKADLQEEGVAVISYGQIHAKTNLGVTMSEHLTRRVSKDYLDTHPQCLLRQNDFVFADTSEDIDGSGNFAFNDYPQNIFAGYHTLVARPKDLLYPQYYAFLFQSNRWKSQIRSLVNGVKVYTINKRILKSAYLLIPPIEEQKSIVSYAKQKCSKINSLIAELESEINYLKEYKQRLIADCVTGQINVQNI